VTAALDEISLWPVDTCSKAMSFQKAMDSGFLVAVEVLHTVLEVLIALHCCETNYNNK